MNPIRRALLSASDKAGLCDLAEALHGLGIEADYSGELCICRGGRQLTADSLHCGAVKEDLLGVVQVGR